jgi:hypothetical protein
MMCRQMRLEFGPLLATTAGQVYCLTVDNLDLYQLELFRRFVATYCFSHRIPEKNLPPLLFEEVVLCLKLNSNVLPLTEAYGQAAQAQARCGYGAIKSTFSEVILLPNSSRSVHDNSISKRHSMTKAQAKLARGALRRTCDSRGLYEPDLRVMRLLIAHLIEMVDNEWPATSDEVGDAWRSLQSEATPNNAPRYNAPRYNAPRYNVLGRDAPRSNGSIGPEIDIVKKVLPALLFVIAVGILGW